MNREKTVDPFDSRDQEDVLSDLIGNKAINTASTKAIKQYTKTKATFNLSQSVLDLLEEAWIQLRKDPKSGRVTKTSIVEASLEILLSELKDRGEKSQIYHELFSNKTIKQ